MPFIQGEELRQRQLLQFGNSFKYHTTLVRILREDLSQNYMTGWEYINMTMVEHYDWQVRPDIVFKPMNKQPYSFNDKLLLVEVKPKLSKLPEIVRGFGQLVMYLKTGHYVIFVCYNEWTPLITDLHKKGILDHKDLLFIFYNDTGDLTIYPDKQEILKLERNREYW